METDRRYFIEGLFVIGSCIAAALFSMWLIGSGHRDDVLYRIHFADSVNGLAIGDPVKFLGVDVGSVKAIALDPADPRLVQVDIRLRKDTPVKTDTKATLKLKGITGVVFIELDGVLRPHRRWWRPPKKVRFQKLRRRRAASTSPSTRCRNCLSDFRPLRPRCKKC